MEDSYLNVWQNVSVWFCESFAHVFVKAKMLDIRT